MDRNASRCLFFFVWLFSTTLGAVAHASEPAEQPPGPALTLDQFQPKTTLQLPENRPQRAKFPVVDVHVHPRLKLRSNSEQLDEYVRLMDQQNIAVCVSLDGQLGEALGEHKQLLWTKHRDRFVGCTALVTRWWLWLS